MIPKIYTSESRLIALSTTAMSVDTVAEMLGLDHHTVLRLLGELRGPSSQETSELCEPVNDDDEEEDVDEDDFDNEDDDGDNYEEVKWVNNVMDFVFDFC